MAELSVPSAVALRCRIASSVLISRPKTRIAASNAPPRRCFGRRGLFFLPTHSDASWAPQQRQWRGGERHSHIPPHAVSHSDRQFRQRLQSRQLLLDGSEGRPRQRVCHRAPLGQVLRGEAQHSR